MHMVSNVEGNLISGKDAFDVLSACFPAGTVTGARVGQLINRNGTVLLVGSTGLYGIPSLAVFNSWGWSFSQVVTANSVEAGMSMVGVVPSRDPACNTALDQINGMCGGTSSTTSPVTITTSDSLTFTQGVYGKIQFIANSAWQGDWGPQFTFTENGSVPGLTFTQSYCPPYTVIACPQIISPNTLTLYGTPTQAGTFPISNIRDFTSEDILSGVASPSIENIPNITSANKNIEVNSIAYFFLIYTHIIYST